jgi:hypothetical protein
MRVIAACVAQTLESSVTKRRLVVGSLSEGHHKSVEHVGEPVSGRYEVSKEVGVHGHERLRQSSLRGHAPRRLVEHDALAAMPRV